jgi:hypothetical protein
VRVNLGTIIKLVEQFLTSIPFRGKIAIRIIGIITVKRRGLLVVAHEKDQLSSSKTQITSCESKMRNKVSEIKVQGPGKQVQARVLITTPQVKG